MPFDRDLETRSRAVRLLVAGLRRTTGINIGGHLPNGIAQSTESPAPFSAPSMGRTRNEVLDVEYPAASMSMLGLAALSLAT